ncbi:MAG: helix-turn-helix domain-containing protein, partial [Leptothrix sp. (in: b-proteobacteria)]
MSEPLAPTHAGESTAAPAALSGSAGAQLRAARLARGYELDQMSLLLKVPVRKLEALEADRFDELPGLAFVRALA